MPASNKTKVDSGHVELREHSRAILKIGGERAFHLELFGDFLAKREGYKEHDGLDALFYYLIQKHHWLPSQARSLNWDDLHFLFAEEMSGWSVPAEFRRQREE